MPDRRLLARLDHLDDPPGHLLERQAGDLDAKTGKLGGYPELDKSLRRYLDAHPGRPRVGRILAPGNKFDADF